MRDDEPRDRARPLAILLAVAVFAVWIGAELSNAAPQGAKNAPESLANPIEQRREMIELLRSIDRRLATIEQTLATNGPPAK